MHNTLGSVARSLKKNVPSLGPKWRFRARQAAANFSLSMHQYGRFPLSRWRIRDILTVAKFLLRKNRIFLQRLSIEQNAQNSQKSQTN
jgi:hypothetical protein